MILIAVAAGGIDMYSSEYVQIWLEDLETQIDIGISKPHLMYLAGP